MSDAQRYVPISDYALIGDCHGVALIRRDGAIDWACLTRFDSGGVFCRMLDAERGGAFELAPKHAFESSRRYLPDTNVLETTFTTKHGVARVIDCFAMTKGGATKPLRQLLRRVEAVRGEVTFDVRIRPRFDYASRHPWIRYHDSARVFSAVGGETGLTIWGECILDLDSDDFSLRGELSISNKRRSRFCITATDPHALELAHPTARTFDARLKTTVRWWRTWSAATHRAAIDDPATVRSALVLKLLTCGPTGSIVAAATTSLPEVVGGSRNWDYRYFWIRDATMTLGALISTGHKEVATGFKRFVELATAGRPDELQIMYGCYGERRLPELTLDWLDGYRGSKPVRIGNAAATQTQLDVYGELLDAVHLWSEAGCPIAADGWPFVRNLVETTCRRWEEPDHGLWEMRGDPQHFVYSKAMCWLAISRGIELAQKTGFACDLEHWTMTRDRVRASIETRGIDATRGCFVQAYGSTELDASLLRLPMIGFIDADDPRMVATLEAIQKHLAEGPLVHRYRTERTDDGLDETEGAFLMTSFWMVDVLAMSRRQSEAEALYDELLSLANDVGLFAEQYDPKAREPLGNFPQAFTHIAQINAAEQLRRGRNGWATTRSLGSRTNPQTGLPATLQHAKSQKRRPARS